MDSGPELERLTRRLLECPAEFTWKPGYEAGEVDVVAVVGDLLRGLGQERVTEADTAPFQSGAGVPEHALSLVLIASWLLYDEWFKSRGRFARPALAFLRERLSELAGIVRPERFLRDPERREELSRLALQALGLVPAGETEATAKDRLTALSSVERKRVLDATRAAREHAERVRAAMREKAAVEAAARYARE